MEMTMKVTVYQRATVRPPHIDFFLPDEDEAPECILKATSHYFNTVVMEWQPKTHKDLRAEAIVVDDATFDLARAVLGHGLEAESLSALPEFTRITVGNILKYQGRYRAVEYILDGCPECEEAFV